jgi:hypothetical protein
MFIVRDEYSMLVSSVVIVTTASRFSRYVAFFTVNVSSPLPVAPVDETASQLTPGSFTFQVVPDDAVILTVADVPSGIETDFLSTVKLVCTGFVPGSGSLLLQRNRHRTTIIAKANRMIFMFYQNKKEGRL